VSVVSSRTQKKPDAGSPGAGMLQIGEVAERLGLSLRTIRYYEELGLMSPSGRSPGGFRLYSEEDVERLALIKGMKPLDLTLNEMNELLDAREQLEAAAPGSRRYEEALERFSAHARSASEHCKQLEQRLGQAQGFAERLARDTRRYRRASGQTKS
jgi:DNA-binding transcriptional MerR regulator